MKKFMASIYFFRQNFKIWLYIFFTPEMLKLLRKLDNFTLSNSNILPKMYNSFLKVKLILNKSGESKYT